MHAESLRLWRVLAACIFSLGLSRAARAQYFQPSEPPLPVLTGVIGYGSTFMHGLQTVNPQFDPILLIPLGRRALIEFEFESVLDLDHEDGEWGTARVDYGVDYLQLDYLLNPNLTVTGGRFLTPIGIYNERIHPIWIRNLQIEPIIFALEEGSDNGAMLRGGARVSSAMNITYSAAYSAPSQQKMFESEKQAGGRLSAVFPGPRLEIGASYQRIFGDESSNTYVGDLTWNAKAIPLDLRGEGLYSSMHGSGYWLEAAYWLTRSLQFALRGEQWFPKPEEEGEPMSPLRGGHLRAKHEGELPEIDTSILSVGLNYYFYSGFRISAMYARTLTESPNRDVWNVGVTYRFAIPLWEAR
jgi:hypothetical protein